MDTRSNTWYRTLKKGWLSGMRGARYQTTEAVTSVVNIEVSPYVAKDYVALYPGGRLRVEIGYIWDGPSGPTYDDRQNMFAALEHDALYGLGKAGLLPKGWRGKADKRYRKQMLRHRTQKTSFGGKILYGWQTIRAWGNWGVLRIFGGVPYDIAAKLKG